MDFALTHSLNSDSIRKLILEFPFQLVQKVQALPTKMMKFVLKAGRITKNRQSQFGLSVNRSSENIKRLIDSVSEKEIYPFMGNTDERGNLLRGSLNGSGEPLHNSKETWIS